MNTLQQQQATQEVADRQANQHALEARKDIYGGYLDHLRNRSKDGPTLRKPTARGKFSGPLTVPKPAERKEVESAAAPPVSSDEEPSVLRRKKNNLRKGSVSEPDRSRSEAELWEKPSDDDEPAVLQKQRPRIRRGSVGIRTRERSQSEQPNPDNPTKEEDTKLNNLDENSAGEQGADDKTDNADDKKGDSDKEKDKQGRDDRERETKANGDDSEDEAAGFTDTDGDDTDEILPPQKNDNGVDNHKAGHEGDGIAPYPNPHPNANANGETGKQLHPEKQPKEIIGTHAEPEQDREQEEQEKEQEVKPQREPGIALLTAAAKAGSQRLQVDTIEGFLVGDIVLITDKKKSTNESITLSGFGSLLLATPLQNTYSAGSVVRRTGKREQQEQELEWISLEEAEELGSTISAVVVGTVSSGTSSVCFF
jgi:hypothetical protein